MKNELISALKKNKELVEVLNITRDLNLPNWYIGAGAIPQTYWNIVHGFKPNFGIKDYDVVYYDKKDLSKESESRLQTKFEKLTNANVDLTNEARVHLWFEEDFGKKIEQLKSCEDAINSWPTTATAVGVNKIKGKTNVYAPYGLNDLFDMIVRPNKPSVIKWVYEKKVEKWTKKWPRLKIISWDKT